MSDLIDDDIRRAQTLPSEFYRDPKIFGDVVERVIGRGWQLVVGDVPSTPGGVVPFLHVGDGAGDPLVLVRDGGGLLRCLSNVCTHRGNLVCTAPAVVPSLRCGYHGRRFALDGRCTAMPEFEGVVGFPSADDDLAEQPLGALGPLRFAAVDPFAAFDELVAPLVARGLPLDRLVPEPAGARSYELAAHFALYCDNYLEGFHIPFVHGDLNRLIDYGSYATELHRWTILQIAEASAPADAFEGTRIAAVYAFLFPNTMLNFYPWGLSANVVVPLGIERTRVVYRTWVWDAKRLGAGAGAALDAVEQEDEAIVEQVQRGVRSRLYRRGRYSPSRETGVHHFHRLLAGFLESARLPSG